MNITKKTSYSNTTSYYNRPLEYIVIHYTAGTTSRTGSAYNTAVMFSNPSIYASADFIVDDTTAVQFNPDIKNIYCWHCGDNKNYNKGASFYGKCQNFNSIGIEVCSSNKTGQMTSANDNNYYFTDAVVSKTVELVKYLMQTYNIPANRVIRHYDVTGKYCPGIKGWNEDSGDASKWQAFKAKISNTNSTANTAASSKISTTTKSQATTANSTSIKAGSVVRISDNATYYNGKAIPTWVKGKTWIVKSVSDDRVVIDKSVDGQNSIMSAINKKYVSLVTASTATKTVTKFTEYKVKVTVNALNIRKGAGTNYAVTGTITDRGVYTIVGEATGTGAAKWLKLKSGAGYIASDYTKKV